MVLSGVKQMSYIENPKTKGSGILCAIPQTGTCPNNCEDCFFQSGRSYLEPLVNNLPNMPPINTGAVVRVNDGNDSNIERDLVISATACYKNRFFNTSIPKFNFPGPVVLTLNPGIITDSTFHRVNPIPSNLMFVRFRTNVWNQELCQLAVNYYTLSDQPIPIVLTFMAYFNAPEQAKEHGYIFRKRTLNSYWAITTNAWRNIMARYQDNPYVYSCGKIEGERGRTGCKFCGNCLREYHATIERMKTNE